MDEYRTRDAVLETKLDYLTALVKEQLADHECRLRGLEKQSPWRTLAESITGIVAIAAMALGIKQP